SVLTMGSDLERSIVTEVRDRFNRIRARLDDGRSRRPVELGNGGLATVARLATGSQAVAEVFERYAVLDCGSDGKRLTDSAFNLGRASIAGILRGLFTADGCVYNYGEKSQSISLDSVSLDMLRQVQLLLLGFGIKAKLYPNRRVGPLTSIMPDGKGGEGVPGPPDALPADQPVLPPPVREGDRLLARQPQAGQAELLNQAVGTYQDRMDDPVASLVHDGEATSSTHRARHRPLRRQRAGRA
ncbi:MAG: LAGLIDADG family homing endonuclease, partial [Singulisphaera sp.]